MSTRGTTTALTMVILAAAGCAAAVHAEERSHGQTVRIVIDYGKDVRKIFGRINWKKDMTILDAMQAARSHRPGIEFKFKGQGATALLTEIDGVENEGGGANARNWQYWVNTDFGDRSFASRKLASDDVVTWKFDTWKGAG